MTIEEACAEILGAQIAHAIITTQGVRWAVVAAMADARTSDNPAALAAIDEWNHSHVAEALAGERTMRPDLLAQIDRDAMISLDGVYRYRLSRTWDGRKIPLVWIMLNPSTADALLDDPTIRRCMSFSKRDGAGGIEVVNLFAFRAADPKALSVAADPIGPDNDRWIKEILSPHSRAICAWGGHGNYRGRAIDVTRRLHESGLRLQCLGITANGQPMHPLYIKGDQPFQDYAL